MSLAKRLFINFILFGATISGVYASLSTGAVATFDAQILMLIRIPRTLSGIAVGGGLAVAGTLIQASMSNPLADPYTLGIASSAALGAVIGSAITKQHILGSSALAFVFSLGALGLLSLWTRRSFRQTTEILLAGVIIGFFSSSAASLILAVADPASWTSALVWLMGSLGRLSLNESIASLTLISLLCAGSWFLWKPLDLLAVDELAAESAGVDVVYYRKRSILFVALITAVCVSTAGVVGFVGLIVPHILRRIGIRSHRTLIPASFLCGTTLVLFADVLGKSVLSPSEIPVGVVTALIGCPFFIWVSLQKKFRGQR